MTKNPKKVDYLYALQIQLQKFNNKAINLDYLRRQLRPFFKTSKMGKIYSLALKNSPHSILFIPTDYSPENQIHQFSVVSSKYQSKFLFTIYAKTNREFIEKLIYKFNFFQ